jgi:hypothetical protein
MDTTLSNSAKETLGAECTIDVKWTSKSHSSLELGCVFFNESGKVVDYCDGSDLSEDGSLQHFGNIEGRYAYIFTKGRIRTKFNFLKSSSTVTAIALVFVSMFDARYLQPVITHLQFKGNLRFRI